MGNPYTEDTSPVRIQSGENQQPQTTQPAGTPPTGMETATVTPCGRSSCKGCPLRLAGKCPRFSSLRLQQADEVCHLPSSSIDGAPLELHGEESTQPLPPLSPANATDNENGPDDPVSDDQEIDFSPPGTSLTSKEDVSLAYRCKTDFSAAPKDRAAEQLKIRIRPEKLAEEVRGKAMDPEELELAVFEEMSIYEQDRREMVADMEFEARLATEKLHQGGANE